MHSWVATILRGSKRNQNPWHPPNKEMLKDFDRCKIPKLSPSCDEKEVTAINASRTKNTVPSLSFVPSRYWYILPGGHTREDSHLMETDGNEILPNANREDVFLLVGDPFGTTIHTEIIFRASALGITPRVIHNASIMNAVGACDLQLYNFGQTVSPVFFTTTWKLDSFYDENQGERGSRSAHARVAGYRGRGAE
ncbi:uncharacterized protein EV420DRAFT_1747650 [Desarmillaria tabescens]|uniref:Diphthine methyl ester synthase n=1 Tax=Armillaria tabescens TaxID=1929756 RepID=A0AA39KG96_ARMTA|nr:uncharacterized protein EV420DRAFT_1747650 [Desarmillaria tabescens]KAK0459326.1 hypothetical protein EV420DRAFT_1747650 [Desarmillaria tabescens]